MFLKLTFKTLKQCKRIRCTASESRENFFMV